jgi:hypothetical protein
MTLFFFVCKHFLKSWLNICLSLSFFLTLINLYVGGLILSKIPTKICILNFFIIKKLLHVFLTNESNFDSYALFNFEF